MEPEKGGTRQEEGNKKRIQIVVIDLLSHTYLITDLPHSAF